MTEQTSAGGRAELARLDQLIAGLAGRELQLRADYAVVAADLAAAQQRRAALLANLPQQAPQPRPPAPVPYPRAPEPASGPGRAEASVGGIQTLLFVVGGLLLGTGVIVFAVVAWTTFGVLGQGAILAAGTVLALAIPPVVRRRGLPGVAETVAVIGLLLAMLDGYAAWRAGLTAGLAGTTWAGAVCAGTALLAGWYGRWTRLAGPGIVGLILAQPVLVLLAAQWLTGADHRLTGVAYLLVATAAGNLVLRWRLGPAVERTGEALRILVWVATGGAVAVAVPVALLALFAPAEPGPAAVAGGALVAGVGVLAGAAAVAGSRRWPAIAVAGLAVAGPLAGGRVVELAVAWWAAAAVYLVVAAGLGVAAARVDTHRWAAATAGPAAVLAGYALLVGLAYPAATATSAAAVLGVVTGLGLLVAAVAVPAQLVVGRAGLLAGLLAWPGAATAAALAAGLPHPWPGRVAMAAAALLLAAVVVTRRVRDYRSTAAGAVHVVTPVALVAGLAELPSNGLAALAPYAAVAALVLATVGMIRRPAPEQREAWWLLRAPAVLIVVVAAAPQLGAVLVGPYTWLAGVWRGPPVGAGVLLGGGWPAGAAAAPGLVLLAAAIGVAGRVLAGRWRPGVGAALLVVPVAVLVGLAELGLRWPVVPAVSLLVGVVAVLLATLRLTGRVAGLAGGYGLVLAGAGLSGGLPLRWSTLTGLAVALVTAAVVGVAARAKDARVVGWLVATSCAVLLGLTAGLAAELPLAATAYLLFGGSGVVLAGSLAATRRLGRPEAAVGEAVAHAGAAVALLLALGSAAGAAPAAPLGPAGPLGPAAGIAVLWGVALGLRALLPGLAAPARTGWAMAAAGCQVLAWWLLLGSWRVTQLEAYTVPAAAVALVVGWWVRRTRPGLGSWPGYGPGLAAALLPSLALALVDPVPMRRLLLGVAAVAVVVAGAWRRLQAPVIVGSGVVGALALRELALVWQLLDTWIPLTVAGLLLVGMAATYERRRRDLARLRGMVGRMS